MKYMGLGVSFGWNDVLIIETAAIGWPILTFNWVSMNCPWMGQTCGHAITSTSNEPNLKSKPGSKKEENGANDRCYKND